MEGLLGIAEGVLGLMLEAGSIDLDMLVFPDGVNPVLEMALLPDGVNPVLEVALLLEGVNPVLEMVLLPDGVNPVLEMVLFVAGENFLVLAAGVNVPVWVVSFPKTLQLKLK